jgi:hypothetical protein
MPRGLSFLQDLNREILDVNDNMMRAVLASLDPKGGGEEVIYQLGEELDGLYIRRLWALGFDYTRRLNLIKHAVEFDVTNKEEVEQLVQQAIRLDGMVELLMDLVWFLIRDEHEGLWRVSRIGMRQDFTVVKLPNTEEDRKKIAASAFGQLIENIAEHIVGAKDEDDEDVKKGPRKKEPRKPQ